MASGMNTDEPPPLPPPDFSKQSVEDFKKSKLPPLRGLIVDPKYPPTQAEADAIFAAKDEQTRREMPSPPEAQIGTNPRRSSGTSQIFNTAPAPTANEIINTMPGGTAHTAGGEKVLTEMPTYTDALKFVSAESVKIYEQPCVREALLQGMIFSFLLGGAIVISGRPLVKAANWTAGSFIPVAVVGREYCQVQRKREKDGMRVAIQVMDEKKAEKRVQAEERRERWRKMQEEKRAKEEEAQRAEKRWWRIWEGSGRGREG